jgi:NTE family protein
MSAGVASGNRIGLVLGGGGARGLAHIGVVMALQRAGIPIAAVAGTSMGGLVGALFAAGVATDVIEREIAELGRWTAQLRLVDISLSSGGLSVRGRRVYDLMADLIGPTATFADLQIPLAVVATDIRSGRDIVIQGGRVIDAVRATISIPGVFLPVDLGDLRLVDGGVLNNVPVDVARGMGVDHVIAVDVLPCYSENIPGESPTQEGLKVAFMPTYLRETYHVLTIMIAAQTEHQLRDNPPDVLIRPDIPADITLLSGFHRSRELFAAGEAAAGRALPAIQALAGAAESPS